MKYNIKKNCKNYIIAKMIKKIKNKKIKLQNNKNDRNK